MFCEAWPEIYLRDKGRPICRCGECYMVFLILQDINTCTDTQEDICEIHARLRGERGRSYLNRWNSRVANSVDFTLHMADHSLYT